MRGTLLLFLGVAIGINISSSKVSRRCYNCNGVASAADCNRITRCGEHEECFEEQVVTSNNILYNSGCRSKIVCRGSEHELSGKRDDLVACNKCCDDDFCNVGLCGGGTPRGLRCLSCGELTIHTSDCDHIEQCGQDQMCYAHRTLDKADMEGRYETGCLAKIQCDGIAHATVINQCFECCNTSMCNLYKCGINWTAVYQTSSQPTFTEATTPTKTENLDQPVIRGTTSLAYHGNGTLDCTLNTENVNYTWTLNGNSIRAPHSNILYIQNMTELKMGMYTCLVSKNGATKEARTNVTIEHAAARIVSVSSSPIPAQSGKELRMHCEVTGYPVPKVYWSFLNLHGDSWVPANTSYPIYGTALIGSFETRYHSGNWTCSAINTLGTDTRVLAIK